MRQKYILKLITLTSVITSSSWSFDFFNYSSNTEPVTLASMQSSNEIRSSDYYPKANTNSMNSLISRGLQKNKNKDYDSGLSLLMMAVVNTNNKAAKALYFLGKQYREMASLPKYQSESNQYNDNAKEYLKNAADLENDVGLYPENKEWALAAKRLLETSSEVVKVSNSELNMLAALAVLESGANCSEERLDIVQSVFNRINSNRFPNDIQSVAFASGQFQPFFPPVRVANVNTETSAATHISQKRGMSYDSALNALRSVKRDVADSNKMLQARNFVGGRTYFKGESEYPNRVASEDPLRKSGCNFHHIEPKQQTYSELNRLEKKGPTKIQAN